MIHEWKTFYGDAQIEYMLSLYIAIDKTFMTSIHMSKTHITLACLRLNMLSTVRLARTEAHRCSASLIRLKISTATLFYAGIRTQSFSDSPERVQSCSASLSCFAPLTRSSSAVEGVQRASAPASRDHSASVSGLDGAQSASASVNPSAFDYYSEVCWDQNSDAD